MSKNAEPNRSQGGTFIRDVAGKLLDHIPPTRPAPLPHELRAARASAESEPASEPVAARAAAPAGTPKATRPAARRGR